MNDKDTRYDSTDRSSDQNPGAQNRQQPHFFLENRAEYSLT